MEEINLKIMELEKLGSKTFKDDFDKIYDMFNLSKDEFLKSYSYISEKDYDLTRLEVAETYLKYIQ